MTIKRDFGLKLELLASVGTSADMEQTAKSSIMKHFTGGWPNSADEANNISEVSFDFTLQCPALRFYVSFGLGHGKAFPRYVDGRCIRCRVSCEVVK